MCGSPGQGQRPPGVLASSTAARRPPRRALPACHRPVGAGAAHTHSHTWAGACKAASPVPWLSRADTRLAAAHTRDGTPLLRASRPHYSPSGPRLPPRAPLLCRAPWEVCAGRRCVLAATSSVWWGLGEIRRLGHLFTWWCVSVSGGGGDGGGAGKGAAGRVIRGLSRR